MLARRGEDGQAVLGVREIDLGQGLVQLGLDVGAPVPGDRGSDSSFFFASATMVRSRTASSVLSGSRRWVGVSTDTAG